MAGKKGIFYSTIKDGKVRLNNKSIFDLYIKNFEGKRVEITIREEGEDWSVEQFRYLYACVYQPLAAELGYTVDELDGVMKKHLLTRNKGTKKEYVKEKSKLNRKDLADYIDRCIHIAAEHGVVCLPADKFWRTNDKKKV